MKNLTILERMMLNPSKHEVPRIVPYWEIYKAKALIDSVRSTNWMIENYGFEKGFHYVIKTIPNNDYLFPVHIALYTADELELAQRIVDAHNGNLLLGVSDEDYNAAIASS